MCLHRVTFEVVAEWRPLYQYPKYIAKFRDEVFTKEVSLATMMFIACTIVIDEDEIRSIGTKASLVVL
jgi:hypothetical protein